MISTAVKGDVRYAWIVGRAATEDDVRAGCAVPPLTN
jgi:hypothetical protein